jgi:hypothetical protein
MGRPILGSGWQEEDDDLKRLTDALTVIRAIAYVSGPHTLDGPNGGSVTLTTDADRLSFIAGGLDPVIRDLRKLAR